MNRKKELKIYGYLFLLFIPIDILGIIMIELTKNDSTGLLKTLLVVGVVIMVVLTIILGLLNSMRLAEEDERTKMRYMKDERRMRERDLLQ